jgi:hypothetical protein
MCIAINRKNLLNKNLLQNLNLINMYNLSIQNIDDNLFNGTIFDGKLINNSIFLIHDCYFLMGESLLDINIYNKLNNLNETINTLLKDNILNFDIKLNKLYTYDYLEELILSLPSLSNQSNGLIFFPKISGIVILYIENYLSKKNICKNENENKNEIKNENYDNIIFEYVDYLKSKKYDYENNSSPGQSNTKILLLSKTEITDVFSVFDPLSDNNKIGIALIPNLKISYMCNSIIQNNEMYKFNCIFSEKFKKWIPISLAN